MRAAIAIALGVGITLAGCESFTDIPAPLHYAGDLTGAAVRPTPVTTSATGRLTAALHPSTLRLAFTLQWSGLSGAALSAHLHGPADDAAQTSDVLLDVAAVPPSLGSATPFPQAAAGTVTGELDLTAVVTPTVSGDSLRTLLNAGRVYVDVHTSANAGGELRAQVLRTN